MKKLLLIGKTGQLGREICKDAKVFGFEIFAFSKKELNIINKEQIENKIKKIKPHALINTAAYHVIPKCEENSLFAMTVNFLAVGEMAKLCKKYNIRFFTFSTDYVFDGKKRSPYSEEDWPNPVQVYGMSKLAGEYACLNIYPEASFVIRTCGLYGGKFGSLQKKGNFVLNIIKEAKNKNTIQVSSEQVVSPTYVGDLSKAVLKLLNNRAKPGIYHLINNGYCSWYEFTKEIFKLAKISTKVKPVNRKGVSGEILRPKFSALKNTKARKLGIKLPGWKKGLQSYFNELSNF